ncbi:hypothetical protein B0I08_102223 [Glaciihabitans tibetensis]|uniref:Fe-S oxidoreductase n=2 Tax=Glaciihabitans tibetensis TaxID=1266600 RepID=A0A2T0VH51_9MICO|nr:hypothetical protein B0I08_102223 [Glaciihabitans tibetensis]
MQRYAGSLERATRAIPAARWVLMNPVVAIPGYWFATAVGYTWGAMLGRALPRKAGGVFVARGLPAWAYGRGGTTIGAVYLTGTTVSEAVLRHEAVHRAQWRRYGVAFIPLYVAAGPIAQQNRFEREAGLRDGGYREDENH